MSVLDSISPYGAKKAINEEDVKSINEDVDRPFLLICSRPLEQEEKDLLRSYGTLLEWDESFMNIPLQSHKFSYCSLDIHNKHARMLIMKTDLSNYHVVVVARRWESEDDFITDVAPENVLRSLPSRQAFKADFDRLLISSKIRKPSCLKSVIRLVFKILSGYSDK